MKEMKHTWVKSLQKALEIGNDELFKKIPQVDLHCHSITSVPFRAFERLSPSLPRPPKKFLTFEKFNSYLKLNIHPLVKDISTVRFLIRSAFQRLIKEGVVYTEMSFDLTIPDFIGVSMEEYLDIIDEERKAVCKKLKVCVEAGLDRGIEPQKSLELLNKALGRNLFGSIDLYGYEKSAPIRNFTELFKLAGKRGLKLKAHVGELGSASDVREAVELLNLDAVQHGIRAADDPSVVKYLVKRGTVFNVCLSSNISLGLAKDLQSHPIRRLFDEGLVITIASDDFSLFRKSITSELIELYRAGIFSKEEIERLIKNGLNQIEIEI